MDKMTKQESGSVWRIERHSPQMADAWDEFVAESRNGTFLLQRRYMDYHSDRFADMSLTACKHGRLLAVLPANITSDGTLHTHQGLTYGGWVTASKHFDGADMLALWRAWMEWCEAEGVAKVDYKPVPWIYTRYPAQEDEYMLFRSGAVADEVNLSAAIDLRDMRGLNTLQRRHLRKSLAMGPEISETRDPAEFWAMLDECLRSRHETAPVHSEAELRLLMERCGDHIRIHEIRLDSRLMAGVCIYDTGTVAHAQYIAATSEGRARNMLTPLFTHLIEREYYSRRYFDFGISNEDRGRWLNEGLLRQKCSYGASGVAYTRWTVDVAEALGRL